MPPGKLRSALANSNKQKVIPAIVTDVLGSKCSVRLAINGSKLTGLAYVGSSPSVNDVVLVDYRNQGTPTVITSTNTSAEPVTKITATPISSRPPQETDPRKFIEFPDADGKFYVAKDAAWVELPPYPEGGDVSWPPVDDVYYVALNGEWVEIPATDMEWPPVDGLYYVAKDGGWVEIPATSMEWPPTDGLYYVARDGNWEEMPTASMEWPPIDGLYYVAKDGVWTTMPPAIEWPPSDDKNYVAKNGAWSELPDSGTGGMEWPPSNGKDYVAKDGAWKPMPIPYVQNLTDQIDGVTSVFLLGKPCQLPQIYINGLLQTKGEDFTVSIDGTSVDIGDVLTSGDEAYAILTNSELTFGPISGVTTGRIAGSPTMTFPHFISAGENKVLVVMLGSISNATIVGATYAGIPLTVHGEDQAGEYDAARGTIYYLVNPPEGNDNVVIEFAAGAYAQAVAIDFVGVDQTTPLGEWDSYAGIGETTGSVTLTDGAEGDTVIGLITGWSGEYSVPTEESVIAHISADGAWHMLTASMPWSDSTPMIFDADRELDFVILCCSVNML